METAFSSTRIKQHLRRTIAVVGAASTLVGALVACGRLAHFKPLILLFADRAPIQFNTALALAFAGLSLFFVSLKKFRLSNVPSTIVASIGGLTLLEYCAKMSLGIDQLVTPDFSAVNPYPGRMAPSTALCFFLYGCAVLTHSKKWFADLSSLVSSILGTFVALMAMVSLVSYFANYHLAFAWGSLNPMTFQAAVQLAILSVGLIVLTTLSDLEQSDTREIVLPISVAAALLVGTIFLWQQFVDDNTHAIQQDTINRAHEVARQVNRGIEERTLALQRMASRWTFRGGTPFNEWKVDADNYIHHLPGFLTIAWIDERYFVRWLHPRAGHESMIGFNAHVGAERIQAIETARAEHITTITSIIELKLGGQGFAVYIPLFPRDRFGGFITAGFRIKELLDRLVTASGYEIHVREKGKAVYDTGDSRDEYRHEWGASVAMRYQNIDWEIELVPEYPTLQSQVSILAFVILISGFLLSMLGGIIARLLIESRDLVRRNRAALEWRRAILDSAQSMIIATDEKGLIQVFNPASERTLGYSASEVIGKLTPMAFRDPKEVQALAERLSREAGIPVKPSFEALVKRATAGMMEEQEVTYVRKDGSSFPVALVISAIRGKDNEVTGFLGIVTDITMKRQAILALESAKEAALEGARIKSAFMANMSHEIRTPLNGIIGTTDLLTDTQLDPLQSKYVRIIQESGTGLLMIINDILDFSKIEAGKMNIEIIDFNLPSIVESQVELLAARATEKGIAVVTEIDPELPPYLRGDPGRIGQILLNLLGNAIKFTHQGSVTVRVDKLRIEGDTVVTRFSVRDTGIGIPESVVKSLFKPFTQADGSMARKYGGTGLGLSISKRLVELLGGEIGVVSDSGKGSTFWFTCPFKTSDKRTPDLVTSEPELPMPTESRGRILIAEDNSVNQMLITALLKNLGYTPHTVANGREALEALTQANYDLVLMDCQMPEMDGYEATGRIRAEEEKTGKHIPILALTANVMKEEEQKCTSAGMDGFIPKPVRKKILAEALDKYFQQNKIAA